ncbi:MAG: nitroreductase/quinone reductase family protein, partial [Acidimicrobiia bacterium]
MAIPKWVAKVNKRVFNPREINKGVRPVLTHVGRKSGNTYQTPLDAHAVDGGHIFIANYGPDSDWVQNILASGTASLRVDG